jgi:hypothetical protein
MNSTPKLTNKYNHYSQMLKLVQFLLSYANPNSGAEMSQESLEAYRENIQAFFFDPDNDHYLKNHAAYDIVGGMAIHGMYMSKKRLSPDSFGKVSSAKEHPCKLLALAAEVLFDAMFQQVGNGHIALFSMFTEKRYGETAMKLEENPQEVYADLMRYAAEYDGHLFSHIIMHTLLKMGADNILKYDNYDSQEVYILTEYVPVSVLLRKGGHRLRRYLAENSLSL